MSPGFMGSDCILTPMAWLTALAMAGSGGTMGTSPTPRTQLFGELSLGSSFEPASGVRRVAQEPWRSSDTLLVTEDYATPTEPPRRSRGVGSGSVLRSAASPGRTRPSHADARDARTSPEHVFWRHSPCSVEVPILG